MVLWIWTTDLFSAYEATAIKFLVIALENIDQCFCFLDEIRHLLNGMGGEEVPVLMRTHDTFYICADNELSHSGNIKFSFKLILV
jgi:hypothetical protein